MLKRSICGNAALILLICLFKGFDASADLMDGIKSNLSHSYRFTLPPNVLDTLAVVEVDSTWVALLEEKPLDTLMVHAEIPKYLWLPPVYTSYQYLDNRSPFEPELSGNPAMSWIERGQTLSRRSERVLQNFMVNHPDMVKYNYALMESPPRKFYGTVNPADHSIEIREVEINTPDKIEVEVEKRHWIKTFTASLQFSQAYISPNWYQGGNNNLNMLANIYYNVKLNPQYHPNLLFESTMQYKLGIYSAPDDSLRNYSVSEDLLQLNATFGVKAFKHWYYSLTGQFKTQLLNSYVSNTYNMKAAFLSPAELTLGLGMTYNIVSKNKRVTFDASIAPLSYNMRTCIKPDNILSHSDYGIDPNKKFVIEIGSSAEAKLNWKIASNITWLSRLFVFSDYHYAYADWENTLSMQINNFLSTQFYVHARYDTSTPPSDNPHWHNLQLKEILSFGVAYKFSTL